MSSGFSHGSITYLPCGVVYHASCIRVDAPFTSRLSGGRGLQYPPLLAGLPFICELCSVRANIGRELTPSPIDLSLVALERMRLIDLAHYWSTSTLRKNMSGLKILLSFHSRFGLSMPQLVSVSHPPVDSCIRLFWCMEHRAIQPSPRSRSGTVGFSSLWSIRSAFSSYDAFLHGLVLHPANVFRDQHNRFASAPFVSGSENIAAQMTVRGLSARLGTVTIPSKILHARHIHWNQQNRLSKLLRTDLNPVTVYHLVAGQCAEFCGWLGWLRSGECFTLTRDSVKLIPPHLAVAFGLPPDLGCVLLSLLPETKSSRTLTADVVLAWTTSSGLLVGRFFELLLDIQTTLGRTAPDSILFQDPVSDQGWSSYSYRHHILFPFLREQRTQGDAYLRRFDGSPGNTLADHFKMFHLYRRGGRSHCRRHRSGCLRAATPLEIYLHGRWKFLNRGREAVDLHYIEPTLEDRIYLTLFCF